MVRENQKEEMSSQRLSNLQKWILVECYKNNGGLLREFIIPLYFKTKTPSREVTVSRSTWGLVRKGYIQGFSPIKIKNMAMVYGMMKKPFDDFKKDYKNFMDRPEEKVASPAIEGFSKIKLIILTDKGKEKARQLLNVKL